MTKRARIELARQQVLSRLELARADLLVKITFVGIILPCRIWRVWYHSKSFAVFLDGFLRTCDLPGAKTILVSLRKKVPLFANFDLIRLEPRSSSSSCNRAESNSAQAETFHKRFSAERRKGTSPHTGRERIIICIIYHFESNSYTFASGRRKGLIGKCHSSFMDYRNQHIANAQRNQEKHFL